MHPESSQQDAGSPDRRSATGDLPSERSREEEGKQEDRESREYLKAKRLQGARKRTCRACLPSEFRTTVQSSGPWISAPELNAVTLDAVKSQGSQCLKLAQGLEHSQC